MTEKKTEEKNLESQFGPISYADSQVLSFSDGLFGYESFHRYLIHEQPEYKPFCWLISEDSPELMFPVVLASDLFPDYAPEIQDLRDDELIFLIISIGDSAEHATANLRAPLLVSKLTGNGRQVILLESHYPLRHPLHPQGRGS